MIVTLPDYCVTSLTFRPGSFATKRYRTISGAGQTRLYGNKATDASLSIEYKVAPALAANVVDLYYKARGETDQVTVPIGTWASMPEVRLKVPAYLIWHFSGEPDLQPVLPSLTTVRVELRGTLDI